MENGEIGGGGRDFTTENPRGYQQSAKVAKEGGSVAKIARRQLESKIGKSAISSERASDYLLPSADEEVFE